jgi:OFA family oxalate/formate antiporter-like MFS transporter
MWGGVFGGVVVGWLVNQFTWDVAFAVGGVAALLAGAGALLLRPPEP